MSTCQNATFKQVEFMCFGDRMHSIYNQAIEGEKLFTNTCIPLMGIFFHFGFAKIVMFSLVLYMPLV